LLRAKLPSVRSVTGYVLESVVSVKSRRAASVTFIDKPRRYRNKPYPVKELGKSLRMYWLLWKRGTSRD